MAKEIRCFRTKNCGILEQVIVAFQVCKCRVDGFPTFVEKFPGGRMKMCVEVYPKLIFPC